MAKKDDGRVDPKDQRALVISIAYVQGLDVLATVPKMEFTTGFIKTVAKRHGKFCAHPTGLDCQVLRRTAEYLRKVGKIKGSGLEGMGDGS